MADERTRRVEELFCEAADRAPDRRRDFLDAECAGDDSLRAEVESLLSADASAPDVLEQPAVSAGQLAGGAIGIEPGARIGAFEIVRVIATGGMGTVFEAVQDEPHRTVALKVMRAVISSTSALRRFRYETECLARLSHPAIATIFESGTWSTLR